jgi:uncharacterized protein
MNQRELLIIALVFTALSWNSVGWNPIWGRAKLSRGMIRSMSVHESYHWNEDNRPHWSKGLSFKCTGCGRCCQNDGDVWFNTEEFVALAYYLGLPAEDVFNCYAQDVEEGWVKMKERKVSNGSSSSACIFLSPSDNKSCTIYSHRPVQCRTYPFWPRLMSNFTEWNNERSAPKDQNGEHWTASTSGCEGIQQSTSDLQDLVPASKIAIALSMATSYFEKRNFDLRGSWSPGSLSVKEANRKKFLCNVSLMQVRLMCRGLIAR